MTAAGTWVQVVVAVIGSSLFGILLTNLAIEYNQPKLRINVDNTFENESQKRYDTTIVNEGNSGATNLLITLHYIGGNITNYRIGFSSENSTSSVDLEHQSTLVTNVSRFAPSAVMLISTIVNDSKAPYFIGKNNIEYRGNYSDYSGSYFVSATYDQGGTVISSTNVQHHAYQPIERVIPFSLVVSLSVGIALILFASFIVYLSINKIKRTPIRYKIIFVLAGTDIALVVLLLYFSGMLIRL